MKPIEFAEQTVVFGKDQPEYEPLPAYQCVVRPGRLVCCWRLNWLERLKLLWTGRIWHEVLTFCRPLQPQLLSADKPEMLTAAMLKKWNEWQSDKVTDEGGKGVES